VSSKETPAAGPRFGERQLSHLRGSGFSVYFYVVVRDGEETGVTHTLRLEGKPRAAVVDSFVADDGTEFDRTNPENKGRLRAWLEKHAIASGVKRGE
jgi:hypothetical protein